MDNRIIYEQPLNEIIRVCLRLEFLFQQIDHQLPDTSLLGTRSMISLIINVLHLLDRPDLKAKLAKELNHHLSTLMRATQTVETDPEKVTFLTRQIEELIRNFIDSSGKLGQNLREVELLNNLRLHLASPGGGCSFDIPIFHYWLQQDAEERKVVIQKWLQEFQQIRTTTEIILHLVRKNAKIKEKTAIHGFHQELLDPQANLRMVRIAIDKELPAVPEISIGRHFLSVRYFIPTIEKRPVQYTDNLTFWLAYCT